LFSEKTTLTSTPGGKNIPQTPMDNFIDFNNIPGNPNTTVELGIDNKPSALAKQKRPGLTTKYAAPGNEMEKAVVEIFERFFGIEPVGIDDDFYELGGDSLQSIQLAALLRKTNINITFRQILMHGNVHEICHQVIQEGEVNPVIEVGMAIKSIESSLAKKYNTNVHYRTYQVKNQSIRILFLEHKPFELHLVLESMNNKNPGSVIYPNYIAFTGPGVNGSHGGQIPEQKNIDEVSLTKLLGLNERISFKDRIRIMKELRKNNRLSRLVKMNAKACKYEASPVQKSYLLSANKLISSQLIYYYHDFSYPADFTKIKDITAAIIQRNSLLRSVIVNIDGNYFIEEFASFSNAPLPFVDISHYPPTSQKKLENIIVRQLKKPMIVLYNVPACGIKSRSLPLQTHNPL
jgi:acyl carrier protein